MLSAGLKDGRLNHYSSSRSKQMAIRNVVQVSTNSELQKLSSQQMGDATAINETTENIGRFVTEGTVMPGHNGMVFRYMGPVSIGAMTQNTGWNEFSNFNVTSMSIAPSKWGGMMGLSEEAEYDTEIDLMSTCIKLLNSAGMRLKEQLASDVLGGFSNTVGDYSKALNYDDLMNELIHMSERYDERWIFGPPRDDQPANAILTKSAIKNLQLASVGGTGIQTGSNAMWGGNPIPTGSADGIYKRLFSMSDEVQGLNVYRGPELAKFPVSDAGVVQKALGGSGKGGMNGAMFYPDGVFMATKNQPMQMRTVDLQFNTVQALQLWFWVAYSIGLNERGATLKSVTLRPRAQTVS